MKVSALAACTALLLSPAFSADPGKRLITATDLYAFQWIADPQISPDGAQVVYTHVPSRRSTTTTRPPSGSFPPPAAPPGRSPPARTTPARAGPRTESACFLRTTESGGKPPVAQIYLLPMDGGEARPLTDLPKGAGAPWSPDGQPSRSFHHQAGGLREKEGRPEEERRPRDHEGRLSHERQRLLRTWPAQPHLDCRRPPDSWPRRQKAKQVTTGEFSEGDPVWSNDGSKIYFTSNRVAEPYYQPPDSDLYVVAPQAATSPKSPASMARWAASR